MQALFLSLTLMIFATVGANYDKYYNSSSSSRSVSATLNVTNGGKWGDWVHKAYCPSGTFARGYALKIEHHKDDKSSDDTALNNIALFCARRSSTSYTAVTTSPKPAWGEWSSSVFCSGSDVFMTSFILQAEPHSHNNDDTAANYVNFRCRKFFGTQRRIINCSGKYKWGYYGSWSSECPYGSAICGMITKFERHQGSGDDDTALNDVMFYCCRT